MLCLGIESTAHTFGVSVVDSSDKRVLSNVICAFKTGEGGSGIIPSKVAEHHIVVAGSALKEAFKNARIVPEEIGLIAFSQGPGIGHCLRVGASVARSLSLRLGKPLVGVNHCIAHLEVARYLTEAKDPVLLYASGANTQVIAFEAGKYRIFGETLDIGVGNFIDSYARLLGLGFPGGPMVEEIARKGSRLISLPYSVKGMDISLGGLSTNLKSKVDSGQYSKEDLCFSVQETVFAMLVEVSERAMAHTSKVELVLGGGVACNKRLQEMCKLMCEERGAKCYLLENQYYVDNAAMIAMAGIEMFSSGKHLTVEQSGIRPDERTDEVEVTWR